MPHATEREVVLGIIDRRTADLELRAKRHQEFQEWALHAEAMCQAEILRAIKTELERGIFRR